MLRSLFINLSTNETARNFTTNFGPSRSMAHRFVAGETLDEAVEVVKALNSQGIKAILNHVGESVSNRQEARQAAAEIIRITERIEAEGLDSSVTLKPSHVGLDFGLDFCYENIADVVQAAQQRGIFVEIDVEASPDVDATLEIYHRLLSAFGGRVRQAIQTYLHRTPVDLEAIIAAGGSVRLVKGAYKEHPEIALQGRDEINQATLRAISMFFTPEARERGAYLALGSHDPILIEGLLAQAAARNVPPDRYEIQMLQGVRRDEQQRLAARGVQVRTYVPFGTAWYPYFMRRLAERPANVLFIARAMLGK
jgi:proline dehydrogenase